MTKGRDSDDTMKVCWSKILRSIDIVQDIARFQGYRIGEVFGEYDQFYWNDELADEYDAMS